MAAIIWQDFRPTMCPAHRGSSSRHFARTSGGRGQVPPRGPGCGPSPTVDRRVDTRGGPLVKTPCEDAPYGPPVWSSIQTLVWTPAWTPYVEPPCGPTARAPLVEPLCGPPAAGLWTSLPAVDFSFACVKNKNRKKTSIFSLQPLFVQQEFSFNES